MANSLTPIWRTKCDDKLFSNVRDGVWITISPYLYQVQEYDVGGGRYVGIAASGAYDLSIEKKDASENVSVVTFPGIPDNTGTCINDLSSPPDPNLLLEYFLDSSFFNSGNACAGELKATITVDGGECNNVDVGVYRGRAGDQGILLAIIGSFAAYNRPGPYTETFYLDFS